MQKNRYRSVLGELNEYSPGKTKEEISKKYGVPKKEIIALASNENPFGTPKKAQKAIKNISKKVFRYPSPKEEKNLKKQIKKTLSLQKDTHVVLGPGEDGVIENIMKTFVEKNDKITIPYPTFSLYEITSRIHGAEINFVERNKDFTIPKEKLLESAEESKLTFICSPNNPTGNLAKDSLLDEVLKKDTLVVLDAAYIEFANKNYLDKLRSHKNLIILRTFSKAYGLAGLRIGYGLTNNRKINKNMKKTRSPFSVSKPSLVAAKQALMSQSFLEKTKKEIKKGRNYLEQKISLETFNSETNFVLVKTPNKSKEITEKLMKKGIIVRDCSKMRGMGDNYIRISVGKMKENKKLIEAINKL